MNFKIDWENLTQKEAEDILEGLRSKFNLVVKSANEDKFHDASFFLVMGKYDDNFHADEADYYLLEASK